jgi:hypothetical protein
MAPYHPPEYTEGDTCARTSRLMMACSHAPVAAWSGHARSGLPVGTRTTAPPRRGMRCSAEATDASSGTRQWLRLECTRGGDLTDTVELQSAVTRLVGTPADLRRYGGLDVSQDVEVRGCCCAILLGRSPTAVRWDRHCRVSTACVAPLASAFHWVMSSTQREGSVEPFLEAHSSVCPSKANRTSRANIPANSPVVASVTCTNPCLPTLSLCPAAHRGHGAQTRVQLTGRGICACCGLSGSAWC